MTVRLRDRLPEVTPRQREVARLVARGFTNPQIAEELGITLDGAKYHVAELLSRLGLYSRAEIAEWYLDEERRRRVQRVRLGLAVFAWGLAGAAALALLLLAFMAARTALAIPKGASADHAAGSEVSEGGSPAVLGTMFATQGDLWSRAFAGPNTSLEAPALAAAEDGGLFVAATFGTEDGADTIDLGGGALTSAGAWDAVLGRVSADGGHIWSRHFGGTGLDSVSDIAADGDGGLVGIGRYDGGVDLGTGPLVDGGPDSTTWIARFDEDGATTWSRMLARGEVEATTVTTYDQGIVVAGSFGGTAEIGGTTVAASGATALFIAAFDRDGVPQWLRTIDLEGRERGVEVTSAGGHLVVAVTLGRSSGNAGESEATEASLALIALDAAGNGSWRHIFGEPGARLDAAGIASAGGGSVVLAANLVGRVDLGGGVLASEGSNTSDVMIARFGADGSHLWSQRFGSEHDAVALGIAAEGDAIYVSGIFRERIDISGTPLESALNSDGRPSQSGFLAQLNTNGERVTSRTFGEPRSARDQELLVGANGDLYASGLFLQLVDVGSGRLVSMQSFLDAFIAKVEP